MATHETVLFLLDSRSAGRKSVATECSGAAIDAAKLAVQIRDGDPAGIAEFYQAVQGGIRVLLRHHLQAQDADAEVREIFSATIQAIRCGGLRNPDRLWEFVRDVVRRQIEEHGRHSQAGNLDFGNTQAAGRERDTCRAERAEVMREVLLEFSPAGRGVLRRYYLLSRPEAEICRVSGLTANQLRVLTSKARDRFRELAGRGPRKIRPATRTRARPRDAGYSAEAPRVGTV